MQNKLPVLDKGYVALVSTSLPREEFKSVRARFFHGRTDDRLLQLPQIHIEIKCPLFVQLSFTETRLTAIPLKGQKPEAYVPTVDEIGARDLESSEQIQEDLKRTSEALLMNPKAYQMDGCDIFVSQISAPISVYNTLIVNGNLQQWLSYINRKDLPTPVEAYRQALADIILAEWDYLWELIDGKKKGR
jgi:hypothetical protein